MVLNELLHDSGDVQINFFIFGLYQSKAVNLPCCSCGLHLCSISFCSNSTSTLCFTFPLHHFFSSPAAVRWTTAVRFCRSPTLLRLCCVIPIRQSPASHVERLHRARPLMPPPLTWPCWMMCGAKQAASTARWAATTAACTAHVMAGEAQHEVLILLFRSWGFSNLDSFKWYLFITERLVRGTFVYRCFLPQYGTAAYSILFGKKVYITVAEQHLSHSSSSCNLNDWLILPYSF